MKTPRPIGPPNPTHHTTSVRFPADLWDRLVERACTQQPPVPAGWLVVEFLTAQLDEIEKKERQAALDELGKILEAQCRARYPDAEDAGELAGIPQATRDAMQREWSATK